MVQKLQILKIDNFRIPKLFVNKHKKKCGKFQISEKITANFILVVLYYTASYLTTLFLFDSFKKNLLLLFSRIDEMKYNKNFSSPSFRVYNTSSYFFFHVYIYLFHLQKTLAAGCLLSSSFFFRNLFSIFCHLFLKMFKRDWSERRGEI